MGSERELWGRRDGNCQKPWFLFMLYNLSTKLIFALRDKWDKSDTENAENWCYIMQEHVFYSQTQWGSESQFSCLCSMEQR